MAGVVVGEEDKANANIPVSIDNNNDISCYAPKLGQCYFQEEIDLFKEIRVANMYGCWVKTEKKLTENADDPEVAGSLEKIQITEQNWGTGERGIRLYKWMEKIFGLGGKHVKELTYEFSEIDDKDVFDEIYSARVGFLLRLGEYFPNLTAFRIKADGFFLQEFGFYDEEERSQLSIEMAKVFDKLEYLEVPNFVEGTDLGSLVIKTMMFDGNHLKDVNICVDLFRYALMDNQNKLIFPTAEVLRLSQYGCCDSIKIEFAQAIKKSFPRLKTVLLHSMKGDRIRNIGQFAEVLARKGEDGDIGGEEGTSSLTCFGIDQSGGNFCLNVPEEVLISSVEKIYMDMDTLFQLPALGFLRKIKKTDVMIFENWDGEGAGGKEILKNAAVAGIQEGPKKIVWISSNGDIEEEELLEQVGGGDEGGDDHVDVAVQQ